jgi:DNA recombination protein RmuC
VPDLVAMLLAALALVLGLLAGFFLGQRRATGARGAVLDEARKHVEDAVGNLARKALSENSEQFLRQAREQFAALDQKTQGELEKRKVEIEGLLKPLSENLGKLETSAKLMEEKRDKAYGSLESHLQKLMSTTDSLQKSSHSLATALRGSSQARGRWGELALKNVAELAGMTERCDFELQQVVEDQRPDMVVRLPGGGQIPVDAKVPLAAFLEATEGEKTPEQRAELLKQHSAALREHVRALAKRDYTARLGGKVDFTVLFVPADPILAAAFEHDPELQNDALRDKILVATPVTLIALLRTVAIYWRQDTIEKNAAQVADAARELYERVALFADHLEGIGEGIESALGAYNKAISSYQARVLPSGQRLEKLQVADQARRKIEPLMEIETIAKPLPKGNGT